MVATRAGLSARRPYNHPDCREGKTPAQVVFRWHIQRGDIVFPKSVTPLRIKENFEIFDFELEAADIEVISALDRREDGRTRPYPDTFAYIPW